MSPPWVEKSVAAVELVTVDAEITTEVGGAKLPYRPVSEALAIASTVSVIIPARNEAANLPHVFGSLPGWVDEVVLVDGHSVDDTVAVTRRLYPQAKVVSQPGRGKGDALLAGFAAATGDILVTIDADGSTDGAELIRFVSALTAGADFAKGSRFSSSGGSDDITGLRRYGNRLLSILVNWMFGTHFTDLCYGYNAFWARHLDAIEVSSGPGFEVETLMTIRAATAGLQIYEVPSHESPRIFGSSNLSAVRDGWRILKVIIREWLRGMRKRDPRRRASTSPPSRIAAAGAAVAPYSLQLRDRGGVMSDDEIVAAIVSGDRAGIAAALDRYGQTLYTYCRARLPDAAAARDAVTDTFVIAAAEVGRLREPDRLRTWLFAVARNECQTRLRAAAPSARLYEAASAMDDTGTFAVFTKEAELRKLIRAALAGMDPVDREISELNLRHGFYGADLADILGAPRGRAHALASRARSRFERSLGVLLMASAEREHCRQLGTILDGEAGRSKLRLRRQIRRHIRRCSVCKERRRSGLNPAILLNLLPSVIPMPRELRQQTQDLVFDSSPAAVVERAQVLDGSSPLGADGFPVQLAPLSAPGRRMSSASAVAAAAAAVALLGGAVYSVHQLAVDTGPGAATKPAVHGSVHSHAAGRLPAERSSPVARGSPSNPGVVPLGSPQASAAPAPASASASPAPSAAPSPSPSPLPSLPVPSPSLPTLVQTLLQAMAATPPNR